jgi:hypothetical protein
MRRATRITHIPVCNCLNTAVLFGRKRERELPYWQTFTRDVTRMTFLTQRLSDNRSATPTWMRTRGARRRTVGPQDSLRCNGFVIWQLTMRSEKNCQMEHTAFPRPLSHSLCQAEVGVFLCAVAVAWPGASLAVTSH